MAVIDLSGYVADLKEHVEDERFPDYPFANCDDTSEAWKTFYRALVEDDVEELDRALAQGLDANDDSGPEGRPIMQLACFGLDELVVRVRSRARAQRSHDLVAVRGVEQGGVLVV